MPRWMTNLGAGSVRLTAAIFSLLLGLLAPAAFAGPPSLVPPVEVQASAPDHPSAPSIQAFLATNGAQGLPPGECSWCVIRHHHCQGGVEQVAGADSSKSRVA